MLLSAGFGTRLRPYTEKLPKPAIPFLNLPLGQHPLLLLPSNKNFDVVVNLHYQPQKVKDVYLATKRDPLNFQFIVESPKILGSGGGVKNAESLLRSTGNVMVMNGDEVILGLNDAKINDFIHAHQQSQALMTILLMPLDGIGKERPGVWLDENGHVKDFGKEKGNELTPFHYPGVYLIKDDFFDHMPAGESNIFYDIALNLISQGQTIHSHVCEDLHWFETGNIDDYLNATKTALEFIQSNQFPDWCARLKDAVPDCELIETEQALVWKHSNSQFDPRFAKGFAVIAEGATVEAPIKNCVVGPGAEVKEAQQNTLILAQ